jgi:hypothetical protein
MCKHVIYRVKGDQAIVTIPLLYYHNFFKEKQDTDEETPLECHWCFERINMQNKSNQFIYKFLSL